MVVIPTTRFDTFAATKGFDSSRVSVEDRMRRPLLLSKKEERKKKADEHKEAGKKDGRGGEAFGDEIESEHEQ